MGEPGTGYTGRAGKGIVSACVFRDAGFCFAQTNRRSDKRGGDVPKEKNLIPFDQRPEEERKELARQGGIASGAARRRKRAMRDAADYYLSLPVSDKRVFNKLARRYVEPEDIDNQMMVIAGLTEAAAAGDARAGRLLFDILGESKPGRGEAEEAQLARAEELLEGIDGVIE